jgi:hypothetical protein
VSAVLEASAARRRREEKGRWTRCVNVLKACHRGVGEQGVKSVAAEGWFRRFGGGDDKAAWTQCMKGRDINGTLRSGDYAGKP